ncbi:MAG: hypothetical protein M5U05_19625 [Anaerolineales bacterium]|nr:hypothetical protein [Anaerolineales bacterium]
MTRGDLIVTILVEVTGRPPATFELVLDAARAMAPGHRLDEELSPAEAAKLLASMRAEREGILTWLVQGARRGIERREAIAGRATGVVRQGERT